MTTPRSNRRQKQAAATHQDILAAARKLFAINGYAATSMAAIATEAETAVQTIYDSVGPKHAIMLALVDTVEEEAGVGEFLQRLAQTNEPREIIALIIGLSRRFMERAGDIVAAMASAAPSEPDVAEAARKARRNHMSGARHVAGRVESLDALAPGVTVERAADILGVLNWGATWQQFVHEQGWPIEEFEAWLNQTIATLVLKDAV